MLAAPSLLMSIRSARLCRGGQCGHVDEVAARERGSLAQSRHHKSRTPTREGGRSSGSCATLLHSTRGHGKLPVAYRSATAPDPVTPLLPGRGLRHCCRQWAIKYAVRGWTYEPSDKLARDVHPPSLCRRIL